MIFNIINNTPRTNFESDSDDDCNSDISSVNSYVLYNSAAPSISSSISSQCSRNCEDINDLNLSDLSDLSDLSNFYEYPSFRTTGIRCWLDILPPSILSIINFNLFKDELYIAHKQSYISQYINLLNKEYAPITRSMDLFKHMISTSHYDAFKISSSFTKIFYGIGLDYDTIYWIKVIKPTVEQLKLFYISLLVRLYKSQYFHKDVMCNLYTSLCNVKSIERSFLNHKLKYNQCAIDEILDLFGLLVH